ncbi:hypothetical protein HJFPF1_03157 [Paramyrothecium foliicola]|nr:hypothetical protein HJFPF1_03157 [Paramyrothecium foliicola]
MSSPNQGQPGQQPPQGPPYASQDAQLGGLPVTTVDVPISAVFVAIFIGLAALNMTILQLNRKRGHKFLLSGVFFGFSMARTTANIMRIVWACYPRNIRIALAASILTNAGVLLLFLANLILSQRILRAHQPRLGWSKAAKWMFTFLYVGIAISLVMVITAIVYNAYTLDTHIKTQMREIQLTAVTYMAVLSFLPIPITLLAILLPRTTPIDHFGKGSMRTKVVLVLFATTLLALGASWRAGIAFMRRPISQPAWFHHKALFYCINFAIEIVVVLTYALFRFDQLYHIPNGSSAPGDYSRAASAEKGLGWSGRDTTDSEFMGDSEQPQTRDGGRSKEQEWESNAKKELETRAIA